MPRHGENIFKRKDGRWEARYVKEITDTGKRYGSVYASSYQAVKQKRKDIMESLQQAQLQGEMHNDKHNLSFFIQQWYNSFQVQFKESTLTKYHHMLQNHILPTLGNITAHELTTDMLNDFRDTLLKQGGKRKTGLAPKTVRDILSLLNTILHYIQNTYGLCKDCIIIYPKLPKEQIEIFSKQDFKRISTYLLEDMDDCKFGIFIAMTTGIRIGELCALKWKYISIPNKTITIEKTMIRVSNLDDHATSKTRIIENNPKSDHSMRIIPLSSTLLALCKQMHKTDDCYVLTGKANRFMEPRDLDRHFKKHMKNLNITNAHFHMLRHTFASLSVDAGFEIKCLSEILGHSNCQITLNRYVHSSFEFKEIQIENFTSQYF